jgi:integrase
MMPRSKKSQPNSEADRKKTYDALRTLVDRVHALRHSMAVRLLEAGRGIEYVADRLGRKNIQNTRIYAQITNPLREQVLRELEQHPKIVRINEAEVSDAEMLAPKALWGARTKRVKS